jgi:serine/threonine protein kinase
MFLTFRRGLLLLLVLFLCAFEEGEIYRETSDNPFELKLTRRLGAGDFGEVWEAVDTQAPYQNYAVKFYKQPAMAERARAHYGAISEAQAAILRDPHLLQYLNPETLVKINPATDEPEGGVYTVVLSEKVDGSLKSAWKEYVWPVASDRAGYQKAIENQFYLMHDLIQGVSILQRVGLSHYDLTPNNVMMLKGRHKLGDLDSVQRIGMAPMAGAWEGHYAPPEYADGGKAANYSRSDLGDAWGIGAILFELNVGKSPLAAYLEEPHIKKQFGGHPNAGWLVRVSLALHPEQHDFDKFIARKLDEKRKLGVEHIHEISRHESEAVRRFILAALALNPKDREAALKIAAPQLRLLGPQADICSGLNARISPPLGPPAP